METQQPIEYYEGRYAWVEYSRIFGTQAFVYRERVDYFKTRYLIGENIPPPKAYIEPVSGYLLVQDGHHRLVALMELEKDITRNYFKDPKSLDFEPDLVEHIRLTPDSSPYVLLGLDLASGQIISSGIYLDIYHMNDYQQPHIPIPRDRIHIEQSPTQMTREEVYF
jgi:hypothetical protein